MNASQRIRQRREELGMSQEELAHKLGYKSRSSVNKVENSRDLSLKLISQYAKVLDVDPAWLLGWDDEPITIDPIEDRQDKFNNMAEQYYQALMDGELIEKYKELPQEYKNIVNNTINSVYEAWKNTL